MRRWVLGDRPVINGFHAVPLGMMLAWVLVACDDGEGDAMATTYATLAMSGSTSAAEPLASGSTASGAETSDASSLQTGSNETTAAFGSDTVDPLDGTAETSDAVGGSVSSEGYAPIDPSTLPALTVWIAGDSTVANGQTPCPRGWGGIIGSRLDERVTVVNSAQGGRSVNTWLYNVLTTMDGAGECELTRDASGEPTLQPRWQQMLDEMAAGDYLLIQFGINDGDRTCDRHVGIEAFEASYGMMAEAAKARGAHPVFLTPVSSISCNGSTARGSRGEYVPATERAGATFDVPVIDLHARSVELYQSLAFCPVPGGDVSANTTGPVGDFFCDDHTHFDTAGAQQITDLVVQGLRDGNIPLAAYLR